MLVGGVLAPGFPNRLGALTNQNIVDGVQRVIHPDSRPAVSLALLFLLPTLLHPVSLYLLLSCPLLSPVKAPVLRQTAVAIASLAASCKCDCILERGERPLFGSHDANDTTTTYRRRPDTT